MPPKDKPPAAQFSEADRAALDHAHAELEAHKHRAWLRATIGRIIKWTLATIAGVTVVADAVIRVLKASGFR